MSNSVYFAKCAFEKVSYQGNAFCDVCINISIYIGMYLHTYSEGHCVVHIQNIDTVPMYISTYLGMYVSSSLQMI